MKRPVLLFLLAASAFSRAETTASDWVSTAVFRDAVETIDAVPFVAALPSGAVFRANGFSDVGRYGRGDIDETIELRLGGTPGRPILHARLLRKPTCGGVNEFGSADIDLAVPGQAGAFRTARFPEAGKV